MSNLPEKVYYDVLISNLNTNVVGATPATYNESRQNPYLSNPSRYNMSIIRWSLDSQSLPIWRCNIQPTARDPNKSIYSFTMTYIDPTTNLTITSDQTYLIFLPQNLAVPVPPAPINNGGQQYNGTLYYDIYNYSLVIYLINETINTTFQKLQNSATTAGITLPTSSPPSFIWDNLNNRIILTGSISAYGDVYRGFRSGQINIYMNPAMANLLSGMPILLKSLSDTTGLNYIIATRTDTINNIIDTDSMIIRQEISSVSIWNPVVSIVITSTTLPVRPNLASGVIKQTDVNGLSSSASSNALVYPIITDFETDGVYKNFILYNPTSEYRRIELIGNSELNNLDISVFWRARDASLNQIILPANASLSIKILFELKN